jgi:hypothetical protein
MKQLGAIALVALGILAAVKLGGCQRSEAQKARVVCEQLVELCGPELEREGVSLRDYDVDDCAASVREDAPKFGKAYDPFVDCVADADSCGEVLGCVADGMLDGDLRAFRGSTRR